MSFGVYNGPPTYQRVVTKTFKEYLDNFMKIFLGDFKVYNGHGESFAKAQIIFSIMQRIWNQSKSKTMCIYGIFRDDLGFYCFQRKDTTRSKENTSNSKHATT